MFIRCLLLPSPENCIVLIAVGLSATSILQTCDVGGSTFNGYSLSKTGELKINHKKILSDVDKNVNVASYIIFEL